MQPSAESFDRRSLCPPAGRLLSTPEPAKRNGHPAPTGTFQSTQLVAERLRYRTDARGLSRRRRASPWTPKAPRRGAYARTLGPGRAPGRSRQRAHVRRARADVLNRRARLGRGVHERVSGRRQDRRPARRPVPAHGEAGAHQFRNHVEVPGATGDLLGARHRAVGRGLPPRQQVRALRVPGQTGYRFRLGDQLSDYWDGEPGAGSASRIASAHPWMPLSRAVAAITRVLLSRTCGRLGVPGGIGYGFASWFRSSGAAATI